MTIFLSEPDEYGGGELVVDTDGIPKTAKLPAGHAVIYSTYSLHRVNPVTSGVRYAAIGWMESHIRLPMHRDLLTDLLLCMDLVTSSPPRGLGLSGDALIYQRVQKVRSNLIRLWAESGRRIKRDLALTRVGLPC